MKITLAILLLSALCNAEQTITSRSKQKTEEKSNKRELVEGNAGVAKRAPILSTVSPSVTPGIEYADSKESQKDKSPSQQIYTAPVSAIAKVSDLLSGQGPSFPTAIARNLYSPISAYQARISSPTTYEVSAPIQSHLAYTEKITYQPNLQYEPRNQNNYQPQQKPLFRFSLQPQQFQPQPLKNQQQIFQQIPQLPYQNQAPVFQSYQALPQNQIQQVYQSLQAVRPGIFYAKNNEKPQRELTPQQAIVVNEIKQQLPQRNYNPQPQGAVSYASFSQSQPQPSQIQQYQPQQQQQQQQHQHIAYQQQPSAPQLPTTPQQQPTAPQQQPTAPQQQPTAPQQQPTAPQLQPIASQQQPTAPQQNFYQPNPQQPIFQQPAYQQQIYHQIPYQQPIAYPQPIAIEVPQNRYQINPQNYQPFLQFRQPLQPQPQYQIHQLQNPQYEKVEPAPTAPEKPSGNNGRIVFRSGQLIQGQPQLLQAPSFQNHEVLVPNTGFGLAAPTFAPIQYFGKFAQSLFGGYQQ